MVTLRTISCVRKTCGNGQNVTAAVLVGEEVIVSVFLLGSIETVLERPEHASP